MPAGADLKEGYYKQGNLSDDEMWSAFAFLFSAKSAQSTSYKYAFLKSILDNLYNTDADLKLTFEQLFSKFTEIYWNLVLKHHIRQSPKNAAGKTTKLEQALWSAQRQCDVIESIPFESIPDDIRVSVCHRVKVDCKSNVV